MFLKASMMLWKKLEKKFENEIEPVELPEELPEPPEGFELLLTATDGSQVLTKLSLISSAISSLPSSATTIDGAVRAFLRVIVLPVVVSTQL